MEYLCAYYWRQEETEISLLLKQLVLHKENIPAVLGCLAEAEEESDAANCFVEAVTEWFYEEGLFLCQSCVSGITALENSLLRRLTRSDWNVVSATVLLCVGSFFVLWRKGGQGVWLLNTRFGRSHYRTIFPGETEKKESILSGVLEPNVGILLATVGFYKSFDGELIFNCLNIKELNQDVRLQKRLKELGEEATRKGEKHPAAMLIVTC